jgi:Na+-transporting methylmalonyl-CoA/oxaloacetate decarboxylase gamma subunit
MIDFQTGLQNIVAGQGVPIAIAGMAIVFSALSLIASFIAVLPRLLRWFARYVPEPALPAPRLNGEDDTALAAVAAAAYHAARGERA